MFNPISFVNDYTLPTALTAVTLGFAPGQTIPPQLLICSPTAALAITLPPSGPTQPSLPTTAQTTVGVGSGYRITVFNTTTFSVTFAGAGSDTIVGTSLISTANSKVTMQAVESSSTWYVV